MPRTPAYKLVYENIKANITDGTLPPGAMLPTESELEETYRVSRTTIRKAIGMLSAEGYLRIRQGSGTYVLTSSPRQGLSRISSITETMSALGFTVTTRGMSIDILPAPDEAARALQLPGGTDVYRVQRVLLSEDVPFAYICNYLRKDLFPALEQYTDTFVSLYRFLEKTYHIEMTQADEVLCAQAADFIDAQLLGVRQGAPLLGSRRTTYTADVPFEYARSMLVAEKYEYEIHMSGR